jgi:hypothetical protein
MPNKLMIGDDGRDIICPWSMKVLYDADFTGYESQKKIVLPLPKAHTWNSSMDSVSLTCHLSHVSDEKDDDSETFSKTPKNTSLVDFHDDEGPHHSTLQFSLVVSIRVVNVDNVAQKRITVQRPGDEYSTFEYTSPCILTLFRGNILQDPSREFFVSPIMIDRLQVPCMAQSVAALAFGRPTNDAKKELYIFFSCIGSRNESDIGENPMKLILTAYYGDSLENFHYVERVTTLDDFALSDREDFIIQTDAIRDSRFIDATSKDEAEEITNNDNFFDEAVRLIESFYMKRLFSSWWGRSLGEGRPFLLEGAIRRAMRQVCPPTSQRKTLNESCPPTSQRKTSHEESLKLDTLTAMRNWAINCDESCSILDGHHTRWIKFMLTVWNEVAKSRQPLVLIPIPCLEDRCRVLLLRYGVISSTIITSSRERSGLSSFETLNEFFLSFLQNISHINNDTCLRLAS